MLFFFLFDLVCLYITGNTTIDLWAAKLVVVFGGTNQVVSINFLFGSVNITEENLTLWMWISTAITAWILWDLFKQARHFWRWLMKQSRDEAQVKS
ncbi:hypothetical protein A3C09_03820 [Candidatus Uhrbacteria bacterium RIFCSPHIGHO2_02_FULL_47_44]|uniref:Uncharacterized protein n=1 Tax=Candidatus Uhrbacteria bacterium RIFCSPLOWO2_02_FULL_48_18 TaxID=1802408 RepID=A0A1F7VDY5_9BACT|nr:MAG: hypothetical protein A2839_00700 [Candidatus Uhrbacteria bacterium RIFCSPHIGHO2_01_FULL_47_10]OGL71806.1 MAG: hypothetical protein A3C09_03820 [Candidatus Uhrbacteria bacterium RIFCSPHIGHO2_02_FULL_47_44]OGL80620.1 MAG: hypothetical protein A3B20_04465 [Candidatus Uhrbacteria bacterium RIFCSPLOWO2_01_FULL_47_17]OGL88197.1 MAG: hypothetical protein A3I41_00515 [Candidatus Uhrbacteria bacterium RIFCSPLOWO2_02_FULL_48_18]OGL92346.1 MAG: hypothetical protein A3H12_03260 [Candidatus Uhrbacte